MTSVDESPNFSCSLEGPMSPKDISLSSLPFSESDHPFPRAALECRPNSHPFQDRSLILDQPVKVGRSVARARPTTSNAIFDCKVLSRNHALIWYKNGKFYLQDTKSSNGTFVNNQRLSKGSEESLPREVCSGDILQFGVDVMENSRQITHGCIIATLKLFLPDGKEAKASPTIMSSPLNGNMPPQDLYLLNQYIQEALAREQLLETKLAVLQRLVGQTEVASNDAWKSLIDEDRLLTRVEILESQLMTYSKNMTEDKLREEMQRLMEEKEEYQEVAKETLKKISNDKLDAVKKAEQVEKQVGAMHDEVKIFRDLYEKESEKNKNMTEELANISKELLELKKKAEDPQAEEPIAEENQTLDDQHQAANHVEGSDAGGDKEILEPGLDEELVQLRQKCKQLESENTNLAAQLIVKSESLDAIQDSEGPAEQREDEVQEQQQQLNNTSHSCQLHEMALALEAIKAEKTELQGELEILKARDVSASQSPSQQLDVEEKITQLIKYKEKCDEVCQVNSELETSLVQLENEVEELSFQSRAATACSMIPLGILIIAIIFAYLPSFSRLFGTADSVDSYEL